MFAITKIFPIVTPVKTKLAPQGPAADHSKGFATPPAIGRFDLLKGFQVKKIKKQIIMKEASYMASRP